MGAAQHDHIGSVEMILADLRVQVNLQNQVSPYFVHWIMVTDDELNT